MHVLLLFFHGLEVLLHRLVQLLGCLTSWQLSGKIAIVDEPDALFLISLLYLGALEQVGHALTVFGDSLVSDMPYCGHL